MFHVCAIRFDVTENLENFLVFTVNSPGLNIMLVHTEGDRSGCPVAWTQ